MAAGGGQHIETRLVKEINIGDIRVSDDGCGMTPEVLERAFDPFFTTKEPGRGTGLGLAICRRIVEEHEGEIEIQSRPDQGTTVSILLPHAPLEEPEGE